MNRLRSRSYYYYKLECQERYCLCGRLAKSTQALVRGNMATAISENLAVYRVSSHILTNPRLAESI
jgi:hypothetical protein